MHPYTQRERERALDPIEIAHNPSIIILSILENLIRWRKACIIYEKRYNTG